MPIYKTLGRPKDKLSLKQREHDTERLQMSLQHYLSERIHTLGKLLLSKVYRTWVVFSQTKTPATHAVKANTQKWIMASLCTHFFPSIRIPNFLRKLTFCRELLSARRGLDADRGRFLVSTSLIVSITILELPTFLSPALHDGMSRLDTSFSFSCGFWSDIIGTCSHSYMREVKTTNNTHWLNIQHRNNKDNVSTQTGNEIYIWISVHEY